jgi:hypothetical protein
MEAFPTTFELSFEVSQANAELPHFVVAIAGSERNRVAGIRITETGPELDVQGFDGDRLNLPGPRTSSLTERLANLTSRVSCRLFVDSAGGTIDIYLNGTAFAQFHNGGKDRLPAKVTRVEIGEDAPTNPASIFSDFRLTPWNGERPGNAGDKPFVSLANGDSASATLIGVRDGKLLMDSEAGPVELSVKQVLGINRGGMPDPMQPSARVYLRNGSILQLDACHFDGVELTGQSPRLGEFKIPRESIAELILHPAPPRFPGGLKARTSEQGQLAPAPRGPDAPTKP